MAPAMGYDALFDQLPSLEAELRDIDAAMADLEAKATSLRGIIQGIKGLQGPAPVPEPQLPGVAPAEEEPDGDAFYGTPAIRRLMEADRSRTWRARDMYQTLQERGWVSPHAQHPKRGLEAAINRMLRKGELERVAPGRYRYLGKVTRDESGISPNGAGLSEARLTEAPLE